MSNTVEGLDLKTLEDPIFEALVAYEGGDGLLFDTNVAKQLVATDNKPNSARSVSEVRLGDIVVGSLYVIAFKPGDGSGDESGFKLDDLAIKGDYPTETLVVPRRKTGVYSEVLMNILSIDIGDDQAEPELFRGNLDLLGLESGDTICLEGRLGDPARQAGNNAGPIATYTVGFDEEGERFGDPHAIYSGVPETLQVVGFLAVTTDVQSSYPDAIQEILDPQYPATP